MKILVKHMISIVPVGVAHFILKTMEKITEIKLNIDSPTS